MKKCLLLILLMFLSISLISCGQKVYVTNYIIGNSNKIGTDCKQAPEKTIGTSMGASIAATAALSQSGSAENSGSAEATSISK